MYYTPPQCLFNEHAGFHLLACIYRVENNVDPDQLASEKPADQDLHCFKNRIYLSFKTEYMIGVGCMRMQ